MFSAMSNRTASIAVFAAAAFWGLYWWPVRTIEAAGLSPSYSVALFNASPLLVLIPLVLVRRRSEFRYVPQALLVGSLMGIGLGLYATAMVVAPVIRVTLLFYLTPVWSTLIGAIWLREPLSVARIMAILMGLGGLFLLMSGGEGSTQPLNFGDYFALASGVFWGFGAAGVKRWPKTPTAMITTVQFIAVIVFSSLIGLIVFNDPIPNAAAIEQAFPIAFFGSVLVLLPTAYVMFVAARQLFPGRVGILMMSEALVAIISATILLPEETLSLWQWVGGITILGACLVEVSATRKP